MSDERREVAREVAERLRARGIRVTSHETDDELVHLLEAVERFEAIVEQRGGDLMVDESIGDRPPREPDNQRFVLPLRHSNESVAAFLTRIVLATERATE